MIDFATKIIGEIMRRQWHVDDEVENRILARVGLGSAKWNPPDIFTPKNTMMLKKRWNIWKSEKLQQQTLMEIGKVAITNTSKISQSMLKAHFLFNTFKNIVNNVIRSNKNKYTRTYINTMQMHTYLLDNLFYKKTDNERIRSKLNT